jgi:hypothetical protein
MLFARGQTGDRHRAQKLTFLSFWPIAWRRRCAKRPWSPARRRARRATGVAAPASRRLAARSARAPRSAERLKRRRNDRRPTFVSIEPEHGVARPQTAEVAIAPFYVSVAPRSGKQTGMSVRDGSPRAAPLEPPIA